jgi:hypothetical protein
VYLGAPLRFFNKSFLTYQKKDKIHIIELLQTIN